MKKHLLFLCFIPLLGTTALPAYADGETDPGTEPMLVVHHYYGNDSYPVKLTDYNKIKIDQGDTYTLVSNNTNNNDITLSSKTYPRFSVQTLPSNIVTSQEQVAQDVVESVLTYCAATLSLKATSGEDNLKVIIFNAAGQQILSGRIASGRELSVASLPAGIYIAAADGCGDHQTLKFTKQ